MIYGVYGVELESENCIKTYSRDELSHILDLPNTTHVEVCESIYRDLVAETKNNSVECYQLVTTMLANTGKYMVYRETKTPCDIEEIPPTTDLRTTKYRKYQYTVDNNIILIKNIIVDDQEKFIVLTQINNINQSLEKLAALQKIISSK